MRPKKVGYMKQRFFSSVPCNLQNFIFRAETLLVVSTNIIFPVCTSDCLFQRNNNSINLREFVTVVKGAIITDITMWWCFPIPAKISGDKSFSLKIHLFVAASEELRREEGKKND